MKSQSLTEKYDDGKLHYQRADISPSYPAKISTQFQAPTGRTVVTTKTEGAILLRYAPKQPK